MRRFSDDERRARLARRHLLVGPAPTVEEAASTLVALHATDATSPYLSAWARLAAFDLGDLDVALFDRRSLVKVPAMRRTVWMAPTGSVPMLHAACNDGVFERELRLLGSRVEGAGVAPTGHGATWLAGVVDDTLTALEAAGEATASELAAAVPALSGRIPQGKDTSWEGAMTVSTHVLSLLSARGAIVRGRPRGSWISTQYRWAPMSAWQDDRLPRVDPTTARAELALAWLAAFGPATERDLKWWTGWTLGATRAALATVGAVEVELDDGLRGVALADDLDAEPPVEPWVALLPPLDPTVMGWSERGFYLGDHGPLVYDTAGNAGPTVWANGRVVGAWTIPPEGDVRWAAFEPVGREVEEMIDAEAERLTTWFADKPRPRLRFAAESLFA